MYTAHALGLAELMGQCLEFFWHKKLNNQPFTVVGDGEQNRDFTYVTDVADAFVLAAESELPTESREDQNLFEKSTSFSRFDSVGVSSIWVG